MPRNGAGVASAVPGSNTASSGTTILSALENSLVNDLISMLNTAWPVSLGGTGGTTAITAWDAIAIKGTTVPSASTLVLSTATGPYVDISGTTAVTAVTLSNNSWRLARATGIFTLTASASLLVNKSATVNYTTAVGDMLLFTAEGGVVSVSVIGAPGTTKGAAVASAGTVVLVPGAFQHITGNTTITDIDFSPANDGASAWVEFDGALTLTHNATTLTLPGGANIPTAAGDRMFVVQDSGDNAHVLFYQRYAGGPADNGTWTPTLTGVTNIGSSSANAGFWSRIGDVVTFSVVINVTPTASGPTASQIDLSLPIASNFATAVQAAGTGVEGLNSQVGRIASDATNDRLTMNFSAVSTAARNWSITGQYRVI